ncbi:MAG: nuclear transport factor 2 family protein [Deltaproteobacteria bacterium]|nr:nuclear transport factor 2 family protein [Deltaproteobacteria bacterium]
MYDLQEIEAIKRLKYKYFRCLDQHSWAELRETFTEDAASAYGGGKYSFQGREQIMRFLIDAMDRPTFMSAHHGHHPEIEITGPATAVGIWALSDYVIDLDAGITLRGAAFYRDEYVKVDGQWKIKFTGYERTFEEIESRADSPSLQLTDNRFAK